MENVIERQKQSLFSNLNEHKRGLFWLKPSLKLMEIIFWYFLPINLWEEQLISNNFYRMKMNFPSKVVPNSFGQE